jgi:hypothetical protein
VRGDDREDGLRGEFILEMKTYREGRSKEHYDDWRDKGIPAIYPS